MRPVTVLKDELLKQIKINRAEHRTIFEEALDGYRVLAIKTLNRHIRELKSGKPKRTSVYIPYPEDHTADYDAVIGMLEMSLNSEVELDEQSYRQLVVNEWAWTRQFLTTNAVYSATASRLSPKDDEEE